MLSKTENVSIIDTEPDSISKLNEPINEASEEKRNKKTSGFKRSQKHRNKFNHKHVEI